MIALVVLMGGVILWVYGNYVIIPLNRAAADLGRQVQTAREELKSLQATTANEASLRTQYQEASKAVSSLRGDLPNEAELPSVIESLSGLATQTQVKIQTIFPFRGGERLDLPPSVLNGRSPAESRVFKETLIQIDALAGFHQLGSFLSLVESGKNPMRISTLRISQNPKETKRQIVKMLIKAYFTVNSTLPSADGLKDSDTSTKGAL